MWSTRRRRGSNSPRRRAAIDGLLERKRRTPEVGRGPRIEAINAFIEDELARHESGFTIDAGPPPGLDELDALFRTVLQETW